MPSPFRNFPPGVPWVDKQGNLTPLAEGFLRALFDYIGGQQGTIPTETIGGDGVTTTTFLREDGTFAVPDYPVGANPSASIGLTANNGSAETFMRSDATPALDQSIAPTWTGPHTYSAGIATNTLTASGAIQGATVQATGAFGCNGSAPQTAVALGAAIGGTAGAAYTATEQTLINTTVTRVNTILSTLKANGIGS